MYAYKFQDHLASQRSTFSPGISTRRVGKLFFTVTKCFDLMFSRALNQDSWSISQEKVLARYANFLLCGLNFFDWILFFSLFLSVKEISLLVVWCHFAKTTPHKFMSHIRGPRILLGKRGNFICTTN